VLIIPPIPTPQKHEKVEHYDKVRDYLNVHTSLPINSHWPIKTSNFLKGTVSSMHNFFLQNTFTYFLFFSVCSFAQFCNVAQDGSRFSQILASWTWKTIKLSHKVLPKKHNWTFKTKKWSNLRRVSMAPSKKKLSKTIQISTLGFSVYSHKYRRLIIKDL
jgi:hypothetical protein